VFASQPAPDLDVVVAGNGKAMPSPDKFHNDAQYIGRTRTSISKIADKYRATTKRRFDRNASVVALAAKDNVIAKLAQQIFELIATSVNIADDVKGPNDMALVCRREIRIQHHAAI
jgi:hypothetical protein